MAGKTRSGSLSTSLQPTADGPPVNCATRWNMSLADAVEVLDATDKDVACREERKRVAVALCPQSSFALNCDLCVIVHDLVEALFLLLMMSKGNRHKSAAAASSAAHPTHTFHSACGWYIRLALPMPQWYKMGFKERVLCKRSSVALVQEPCHHKVVFRDPPRVRPS